MQTEHKQIVVTGKVQGVFFRASTKKAAEELGIAGRVKNLPDGSVWIAAEGPAAALEQFIAWCRQGPPRAEVTALNISTGAVQGYSGFEIERG
jgi:acylphosphatase